MKKPARSMVVLLAEDDPEDQMLIRDAFHEARMPGELVIVEDGDALCDYLHSRGAHADARAPDILLLDLNMPKKNGREALKEIKAHPRLRRIPIIVLTTSISEEDVRYSYEMGVSSFIRKPVTYERMVEIAKIIGSYWFETVELPSSL